MLELHHNGGVMMICYKCDVCGMIVNSLYVRCLGCGVESTKTKE
jgi:hypothetical protein